MNERAANQEFQKAVSKLILLVISPLTQDGTNDDEEVASYDA